MEDVARRRGRRLWAWLPACAWAALIFYMSSRPSTGLPSWWFMRHDKVLHAAEYFCLGALLLLALRQSGLPPLRAALAAAVIATGFGISDEYHQAFVPGRQGNDPGDILADTIGASAGSALSTLATVAHRRRRKAFI